MMTLLIPLPGESSYFDEERKIEFTSNFGKKNVLLGLFAALFLKVLYFCCAAAVKVLRD